MTHQRTRVTTALCLLKQALAGAVLSIFAAGAAVNAGPVTVSIDQVRHGSGTVAIALCDEDGFLRQCQWGEVVPARQGQVTAEFEDVPPGDYAVMAFHDENGDGRMARRDNGMPAEGWAFSNPDRSYQGPPSFAAASVRISDTPEVVKTWMLYPH